MNAVLENIPFFWTALAHWLTCVAFMRAYDSDWRKSVVVHGGFLVVLIVFAYFTSLQSGLVFNVCMACFAMINTVHFAILTKFDTRQVIYHETRLFMISGYMASMAWQLYIYYASRMDFLSGTIAECCFMLGHYALLCVVMLLLERPKMDVGSELRISWTTSLITLALGLGVYIMSSLSFTHFETPFGGSTYADAFNVRSQVYFGGVMMLYAVHLQLCQIHTENEKNALQRILDMQVSNYRLEQTSIDLVNRKYHDLKHQISLLRSEIGNEAKLEYLDKLEQEIKVYEALNKTGNEILDTILATKTLQCQKEEIEFHCVADGSLLGFMDMADISSLFGNALDNAIEAVSQVKGKQERMIDLSVSRHKGFLRIQVRNRFEGDLKTKKGFLLTTKRDDRFHGYGLKSIAATAEKYKGSMTYGAKDGWFDLRILMPMNHA